MFQSAKFIQDHTQRPHVRLGIVAVVLEHLGAHVVGRPSKGRGEVRGSLEDARDTKVPQFYDVVLQEDVPAEIHIQEEGHENACHVRISMFNYPLGDQLRQRQLVRLVTSTKAQPV